MSTRYTLWDFPSSSLLLETSDLAEIAQLAAAFVKDNGEDVLGELVLGITPDTADRPTEHTGVNILKALEREQTERHTA